ncbi:keratin-associated protein 27-1 [Ochotona princeps]|uniref:keratin-associated protein 27-1 n=1 Tax=Ochotona princeps TaxID=9978 RepID=UPI0027151BF3|nr:keratin-associated protein 27-1 [Ochotona princeps]
MALSHCHSLGSFSAPQLSAIIHASNPMSFDDGLCLPSSCHGRTWLLDNFQETCSKTTSCQLTSCEQNLSTGDSCKQRTCLPTCVQTTSSISKPCEKVACQSQSLPAVSSECASQPCQSGNSHQLGFAAPSRQPASYMAKCSAPKTSLFKKHQTLQCESTQCQSQNPESSSCGLVVNVALEPQKQDSPCAYEPTCCITGGLQSPSK